MTRANHSFGGNEHRGSTESAIEGKAGFVLPGREIIFVSDPLGVGHRAWRGSKSVNAVRSGLDAMGRAE